MDEAARLARLETVVARLQAEMALKDQVIIEQLARIAELERSLEEVRRGGKRQVAPFSKGGPETGPETVGPQTR